MGKRFLKALALSLIFVLTLQALNLQARTINTVTRDIVSPQGVTMLTDIPIGSEQNVFRAFDADDRNVISRIGSGRVRTWESEIDFIVRAPELTMRVFRSVPAGTEFSVRLHNLTWFFRSVADNEPSIFINEGYSGGIELLLPTNYNLERGTFIPNETGTGGTYTRIVGVGSQEVPYKLIICDSNNREATIVLLRDAHYTDIIRIPLVTKMTDYTSNSSVEIIGTENHAISSGIHSILAANPAAVANIRRNNTTTTASVHITGTDEIRIPEIVIRENTHGIIGNGSFMLTAPEGFIIVPDTDFDSLGPITRRTPYLRDSDGEPIIGVRFGGGLSLRDIVFSDEMDNEPRREAEIGTDISLRYLNPAGNINASVFIIRLDNVVESRFRNPGYLVISGLKLVAVGDIEPGPKHINISAFTGMEDFTEQSFRVGTIVE